jgi:hypothetical protein
VKLIQRRRLGLPTPDPFDVAWNFSKGEMSLEKSVFDWFDPAVQRNIPMRMPLHEPRKSSRHAAMLESMKTNATPEVKPQKLLDDGISAMPLLGTGHEEHTPDPNAHHEPKYLEMDTKPYEEVIEENRAEKIREATREQNIAELIDTFLINVPDAEFDLPESNENVVANIPFADLSGADPEVVMPDKSKTVTEGIKAARERTLPKYITPSTDKSVVDRIHGLALDGNENALKLFRDNKGDLVDAFEYDEEHEFFEKGIQTIVENPFANPFYDTSAFSIKKERPKGFVAPPAITPPIDLIKQEQPNAIEGFETNKGDDLSLLPSSVFKNTDAPVVDNMSLLPTGWKNE